MFRLLRVVIYSGGLDSYTTLHKAMDTRANTWHWHAQTYEAGLDADVVVQTVALSFDYGQRHFKELDVAEKVCHDLGLRNYMVTATHLLPAAGSTLTNPLQVPPDGHSENPEQKSTVVPGRNTVMLSIALAHAEAALQGHGLGKGAQFDGAEVWYGAHMGDRVIYPDCRAGYVDAMASAFRQATDGKVRLVAPYVGQGKADIIRDGLAMGLNFRNTWTCYKGGPVSCGVCGSCQERLAAFHAAGVEDPLEYLDREAWKREAKPPAGQMTLPGH